MKQTTILTPTLRCVLAFTAAFLATLTAVRAQENYDAREVALGHLCVHEGGWRVSDCAAIVYSRSPFSLASLRRMHPRAIGGRPREAWIGELSPDGTEPASWPESNGLWSNYDDRWAQILQTVRRGISGRRPSTCSERPDTWEGPTVPGVAARIANVIANGGRVVCTGTVNTFLVYGGR